MKGWLFEKTYEPLKLIEKEDPQVVPGEVIVNIKASGLCHSDVAAMGDPTWMGLITGAPLLFGHECAGVVEAVGEDVTSVKVGDRVGLAPQDPLDTTKAIGYTRDGGYATKVLVPERQCVLMPDNVNFVQGAAGTDAGMTSYHALFTVGGAKAGMKVAIIGIGGLGQFALQMAMIEGCEVYAVDVSAEARELAKELGCTNVYENISDLADIAPELIVDYAGFGTTTSDAVNVVAVKGTVVVVGMARLESNINTYFLINKQVSLKGSLGGTPEDIAGVYKFFGTGKLTPQLSTIEFEKIDEGLEMLKRHEVKGRLVAVQD